MIGVLPFALIGGIVLLWLLDYDLSVAVGAGTGSETMRRIAAPMVGGVVTATVVTLILIPIVYALIHGRRLEDPEDPEGLEDATHTRS